MKRISNHPFKTYKEQLYILSKEKGLEIDNPIQAVNALQHYSYYTIINGYKDLFIDKTVHNKEKFKKGTTFSMLYQAHWIDISFSNLIFKYSLLLEKKLKTRLSYFIAKTFGAYEQDYLNSSRYSNSKYHRGKLGQVKENIDKNRDLDISAIHYMNKEGSLPPWIATKAISFGATFLWYDCLTENHKHEIIKNFIILPNDLKPTQKLEFFKKLIGQVYDYRNLSAHGKRSFNLKVSQDYKFAYSHLKKLNLDEYFNDKEKDGLYSIIFSLLILIDDPFAIANFIIELRNFFKTYAINEIKLLDKNVYDLFSISEEDLNAFETYANSKQYPKTFYE